MKLYKLLITTCIIAFTFQQCQQQSEISSYNKGINITPKPLKLSVSEGSFQLNTATAFAYDDAELTSVVSFFQSKMNQSTGYSFSKSSEIITNNCIALSLDPSLDTNDEGYALESTTNGVSIKAKTTRGIFYGLNTLLQLLPAEIESKNLISNVSWTLPLVSIQDEPRFSWRGFHLDVCRHFISIEQVMKHIDMLATLKMNKFHWHLTEDQGWRIEIKKYPKLTEIGGTRTEANGSTHAGFYTQDEIKKVVAYASERFVDVIPEIEMPGHALAALSAYPNLSCREVQFRPRIIWGIETEVFCAGKEETFQFLEDVMAEIIPLFPYEYYHVGGDESPKDRWKECDKCQSRIREEGLKDEHELQSYFINRMEKVLQSYNKKMIGWDEILEGGVSKSANIMSWRGEEGGIAAANAGNDVIMTPGAWMYLDKYEGDYKIDPVSIGGLLSCEKVYNYEPIPEGIDSGKTHHVLGAQSTMWTEYVYDEVQTEYRMYPRVLAVAELTWTSKANKDYSDFERRLNNQMVRLDGHEIEYYIPLPEGPTSQIAFIDSTVLDFNTFRPVAKLVYTTDGTEPNANSATYNKALVFKENTTVKIVSVLPQGKMSTVRTVEVEKQSLSPSSDVTGLKFGLATKTAFGKFIKVAEIEDITEWKIGSIDSLSQANTTLKWGFLLDENQFRAVVIEGYIEIPEDGVYFFSSNQEQVWIDDALVVDNDGFVKRFSQNDGSKALSKGNHKLKVIYFNNVYGGWASDWNTVGIQLRKSTDEEFRPVSAEMLSY